MPGTRVSRRGGARFHGPRFRVSGAFLLPDGFRSWLVLVEAECEQGDLGFAGDGGLGGGDVRELRACFLRAPGVALPPARVACYPRARVTGRLAARTNRSAEVVGEG